MSMEAFQKFLERCDEDDELGAKAVHIWTKVIDNPGREMLALAKAHGFDFTDEEGERGWEQIKATGELPDRLLAFVAAGGSGSATGPCVDNGSTG